MPTVAELAAIVLHDNTPAKADVVAVVFARLPDGTYIHTKTLGLCWPDMFKAATGLQPDRQEPAK